MKKNDETTKPIISKYAAKKLARAQQAAKEVAETSTPVTPSTGKFQDVPEHINAISHILIDNAAIRRLVSLNILSHMTKIGKLSPDAKGKYVRFYKTKFCIVADDLKTEYKYTEEFFLNALIAAFPQFAGLAQTAIQNFMLKEDLKYVLDGKV